MLSKKEREAIDFIFNKPPATFEPEPFWDVYDSTRLSGLFQRFMNQTRKRKLVYYAEVGVVVDHLVTKGCEVELGGVDCVVLPKSVLDSIRERGLDDSGS